MTLSPIPHDYFYDVTFVSDPDLSSDGAKVAFAASTSDRTSGESRSRVFVADLPNGKPRACTSGPNDHLPKWSPDGRSLAFLRRDDCGKNQLWVTESDLAEASRLTDQPGGISSFAWSPDGAKIAFQATVEPAIDGDERSDRPIVINRLRYKADGTGLKNDAWQHLFVLDLTSLALQRISEGDYDHYGIAWSPDGQKLAFVSGRHADRDVAARSEAYVVPVTGGDPVRWSGDLFAVGSVAWSPDGERLAAIATPSVAAGGGCSVRCQGWIYVLTPDAAPRRISDDSVYPVTDGPYDTSVGALQWTRQDEILFQGDAKGQSYLCAASAAGGPLRKLTNGNVQIAGWSADAEAKMAATISVPTTSVGDVVLIDLHNGSESRLTSFNDSWFVKHPVAKLEKFTLERDGFTVEARLWFPPDFDPAKRYPLVLDVHGGPHSSFYDTFYALHQVPAAAGYLVLGVNPRGTSTYGRDFVTAVHGDWADGPYADVMAGLELVAKRPYVDPDRIVMHGSSYGGYMGGWIAGHTDRFKAIVIGAPVTNLPSFYGTSDIGVTFTEVQMNSGRFDDFETYVKYSPLTYAPNVKTPLLIIHGEKDDRVPIEQGEQMFVALKRLGKDVEFVRLPNSSHGLFRNPNLRLRAEYFRRVLEWFDRHL